MKHEGRCGGSRSSRAPDPGASPECVEARWAAFPALLVAAAAAADIGDGGVASALALGEEITRLVPVALVVVADRGE